MVMLIAIDKGLLLLVTITSKFWVMGKASILMILPNVYTQSNEGFKDLSMRKIFPTIVLFIL
jgi:hypothetical protein